MGKKINLSMQEIKDQMGTEIDDAREWYEKQREVRMDSIRAYYRDNIGTEQEGRSQAQASDVQESVEWVMPHVLRQVLASDDKIQIRGEEDMIGKGLKVYARDQIDDQGGFRFFYDWCKDALIGDNGFVKVWWKRIYGDAKTVVQGNLSEQDLAMLMQDPDYEITEVEQTGTQILEPTEKMMFQAGATGQPPPEPQEIPVFGAKITHKPIIESVPVYENIPSYEFICAPECKRMNDERGKGHRTWKLMGELEQLNEQMSDPEEGNFFTGLDTIPQRPQGEEGTPEDSEKAKLDELKTYQPNWQDWKAGEGAKRPVEFIEYYTNLDVNGKLVPSVIWVANGEPLRAEENDEGVNICTWSPMLNPHNLYGMSYGTLLRDIQNIKTMMMRAMLDSVAYGVDKAWIAQSASGVDLAGLQRLRPGKVVIGDPNMVQAVEIEPMDPRLFAVLDYLDVQKENRSGGFKPAQGQPDSDAKTKGGTLALQRASFSRIDLVVLIFAEVGLKDLYQKTISLIQKNLDRPTTVMVDGLEVHLTPENIQGDYKARSSMGIQVDFNEQEYRRLEMILDRIMSMYEMFPFLFPAEKIYNVLRRMFAAAGFKDQDEMMSPPPPGLRNWFMGIEAIPPQLLQGGQEGGSQNLSLDQGTGTPDEQIAAGSVTEGV